MKNKLGNNHSLEGSTFDAALVGSSSDPEEAIFAKSRAPGVLDLPVLLSRHLVNTITDQKHSVADSLREQIVKDLFKTSEKCHIHILYFLCLFSPCLPISVHEFNVARMKLYDHSVIEAVSEAK